MTKDDMEIVAAIRTRIADRVGQERFSLWFGADVEIGIDAGSLLVCAPNQFRLDLIRSRFLRDINAALQDVGQSIAPKFLVVESQQDDLPDVAAQETSSHLPVRTDSGQESKPKASSSSEVAAPSLRGKRRFQSLRNMVVGECNQIAFTAAVSTATRPGAVTPLFLHGPTGTGKTHLLEGIWTAVRKAAPRQRMVMLSAEQFTTYFLEALRGTGLPSFRRKYRDVELLLIDDVQFFAGKRATLVELQHTIDSLLREGKQVVLAADRSPAELAHLGPELTARMSGGLVCGLEPLDIETRRGILRQLAKQRGMAVPNSVVALIADQIPGDARQLCGALNRLEATSQALEVPVTLSMAEAALADLFQAVRRVLRINDIEEAVCDVFGVESDALHSTRRSHAISQPRMLAMWLARKYTRAAYSEIGDHFGHRSHSTVISAAKKVTKWVEDGSQLQLCGGDCHVQEAIRKVESRLRVG